MADRTAFLIRCSPEEASEIRERAFHEHRTVSGYLLHILETRVAIDDKLEKLLTSKALGRLQPAGPARAPGPRAAVLLRCSIQQANRIRAGARRRGATVNAFVLHSLWVSWSAEARRRPDGVESRD